jgi:hypothetical protein
VCDEGLKELRSSIALYCKNLLSLTNKPAVTVAYPDGVLGGSSTPSFSIILKYKYLDVCLNCICLYIHVSIISVFLCQALPLTNFWAHHWATISKKYFKTLRRNKKTMHFLARLQIVQPNEAKKVYLSSPN